MEKVTVAHKGVANGEPPVPTEIIAESIVGIAKGMQKIEQGRLNQDALVVLLHDATKISRRDIEKVLRALRSLESLYCKPVPKKVQ